MNDQAEQLRKLVNSQSTAKKKARVITVTSGKGGVGKSSLSVNLAICLAKKGQKVVILDADFGLANIEVMLGIRPTCNLADLMFRGKDLKEVITPGPEGVGFISGGSGIAELSRLTREQVVYLVSKLYQLDEYADVIIVDTGAGISDSVLEFVATSSEVLIVATPEPTSITDAYALLKTLNRKSEFLADNTVLRCVSNRIKNEDEGLSLYTKLSTVADKFLHIKLEYLGGIVQDPNCSKAVMMQNPMVSGFPNSPASKDIEAIANKLAGDEAQAKDSGIAALFGRWMKVIYKKK